MMAWIPALSLRFALGLAVLPAMAWAQAASPSLMPPPEPLALPLRMVTPWMMTSAPG